LSERRCYMGIADDDGIESFIPCASAMQNTMHLRAQANRGQNAIVFRCMIEEDSARLLLGCLEKSSESKIALLALKCMMDAEQATVEVEQDETHRWDIIPRGDANEIVAKSMAAFPFGFYSQHHADEINGSNTASGGFITDDMEG